MRKKIDNRFEPTTIHFSIFSPTKRPASDCGSEAASSKSNGTKSSGSSGRRLVQLTSVTNLRKSVTDNGHPALKDLVSVSSILGLGAMAMAMAMAMARATVWRGTGC